ncbi:MAG: ATP-grasp domain-containing protein [Candidatus Helarchaeota archaeon]
MNSESILVIGVNSRPIAASAKALGLKVNVIDYWGDQDLRKIANDILVVRDFEDKKENILGKNVQFSDILFYLTKKMIEKHPEINTALIGSGLDDRYDIWQNISKLVWVEGNEPIKIKRARDRINLNKKVGQFGLKVPKSKIVYKPSQIIDFGKENGYPLVLRASWASGGGRGILRINSEENINASWKFLLGDEKKADMVVQEYIPGKDISITSLNNEEEVHIISINEQLIGLKQCNAPTPFAYCGNIIPIDLDNKIKNKIIKSTKDLLKFLKLRGINGVDLKIYGGNIYFMEVNPRFPGTMELLELLSGFNMVKLHIDSCKGKIIRPQFPKNKYGIKIIPYAKNDFKVNKSFKKPIFFDIPSLGTIIKKGDPILTIQILGDSREKLFDKTINIVENLYLY